jgi:hypothetical protein
MKTVACSFFLLVIWVVHTSNAAASPEARVVRISNPTKSTWQISVNNTNIFSGLEDAAITNEIAKFRLHQGDLMLLGNLPATNSNASVWGWIRGYCDSNNVAVYLCGSGTITPSQSILNLTAYHWSAPYARPRDLAHAVFFREGELLGSGKDGFNAMLQSISNTHLKRILILGSLYDIYSGYGPHESPYEELQGSLDAVLKESSTESVTLDPAYGF